MALSLDQLILRAREQLNKITGLKLSTTLGVTRHNGTWLVSVELVEKHSIPDGMDIPEELNYREKTFDPVKIIS